MNPFKRTPSFLLVFLSCYLVGSAQEPDAQKSLELVKAWFNHPSLNVEQLDPKLLEQLTDSGATLNHQKEGHWVEYSLDTTLKGMEVMVQVGDKRLPVSLRGNLQKETGRYANGKRWGIWTLYQSFNTEPPFSWSKQSETEFKNGLKDGRETTFQSDNKHINFVQHWKAGVKNGESLIFHKNSTVLNFRLVYAEGKLIKSEEFAPTGMLVATLEKHESEGTEYGSASLYDENGKLKEKRSYVGNQVAHGKWTSYYPNGKVKSITHYAHGQLDGVYFYYHENGQLWTERLYRDGLLWEVRCNYSENGEKNDPGTLKNGTGTVHTYATDGKLKRTVHYLNGTEVRRESHEF